MEVTVKTFIAAVGGFFAYWLGGVDQLLTALVALIVVDYLTGIAKAILTKTLSSEVGWKGIVKKLFYLAIVALAFVVEGLFANRLPLREITIMFFIANEGISILENAAQTGLPFPVQLKNALIQLKGKDETNAKDQ